MSLKSSGVDNFERQTEINCIYWDKWNSSGSLVEVIIREYHYIANQLFKPPGD